MAEKTIAERLEGVSALGNRVYPMVLPQDVEYPAATYQRISAIRTSAFGRDSTAVQATIQVDVYTSHRAGADPFHTVSDDVRQVLQRQPDPTGTPPVYDMFIDAERDDYEDETKLYRKSFDVRAWYQES